MSDEQMRLIQTATFNRIGTYVKTISCICLMQFIVNLELIIKNLELIIKNIILAVIWNWLFLSYIHMIDSCFRKIVTACSIV
jgi:hypothetical protein